MEDDQSPPTPAPCWSKILKQQPPTKPSHQNAGGTTAAYLTSALGVPVGSCKSTEGIAVAVVDANAIIQGGQSLAHCAGRFVSVSEVICEVRDPTSRHSLNFLPFSIETLEPSPDALKKVINFARATGDLQTLSDVDLKLIALTYTLETQIHGTQHLRERPPPIHTINVKRLPEKDMPGWGSNVPNVEEWEALEHLAEDASNSNSKILPLKDLSLNVVSNDQQSTQDGSVGTGIESYAREQEIGNIGHRQQRKYPPVKKVVKIEGKKMVADGIDATMGQFEENAGDFEPAVSRSTRRRYLRRKARREMHEALSEKDDKKEVTEVVESEDIPELIGLGDTGNRKLGESTSSEREDNDEDISVILHQMRLEEESSHACNDESTLENPAEDLDVNDLKETVITSNSSENVNGKGNHVEIDDERTDKSEISSENGEHVCASHADDNSSEQSWMLRSLSESSVACITSDYAMQNVILQMGLRLLAPGGMQIRELHRWVLRCHACFKVTTDIGRLFCPSCGNGGTLRKVAVTVGENGIVVAARRSRVSVRGTKFSLPLPQGGRDAITKNPILREDQLPQKFLYPKKKNKKQGDGVFTSDNIFQHHTDKRAPLQPPMRKALAVFGGKRNPNDNHYSRARH